MGMSKEEFKALIRVQLPERMLTIDRMFEPKERRNDERRMRFLREMMKAVREREWYRWEEISWRI